MRERDFASPPRSIAAGVPARRRTPPVIQDNNLPHYRFICKYLMVPIHFHWRPTLTDPDDEMVLELAIAAEEAYIVTFNHADFRGAGQFGIRILTPGEFLKQIGALP